ncbi:nicotinamide-nucleotide amidohydrolase family protein [Legionella sp. MW5194]|uniref:CinA family protein n=1 Tax=Legionella sp. MW5194 TaxID=2662448 RepID=UPI00193E0B66|nr:CinA family protein [Legionella sp. MW5194]QRN04723.1 nicotinamide-nucleotide amidohydrolase family protein [Legionella sp. MW5194]
MNPVKDVLAYLKAHKLVLTTAESCTAGRIIHLLSKIAGSGTCLDAGYVVYSEAAKKRLLGVKQKTIDRYGLTSEEVAHEMALGALKQSAANVVVATTGVAGPGTMDGIPQGTICFAWGFLVDKTPVIYSQTRHFPGNRSGVQTRGAEYALVHIPSFHQRCHQERSS